MIETTLGKYEIQEEIGRGGMAVVYRGYDNELEREVAVKILHPYLSSQKESKRRFHREARAVARLRHTNILEIFDYSGKDSDQTYIVTEFIHGSTLGDFCEKRLDMPTEVAALIGLEICRGLRHAHENMVIHRDIKPENIMIRSDGVVKITDFGIAQMAGTTQMTITGQILGSPAHMSPEHVENKPLDFRADLFSMGTLMYWLTTGRLPFEGRNPHAVIKRIVDGEYPDPLRVKPAMGDDMARIIRRCLEVDPEDRHPGVEELIADLEAFLKDVDVPVTGRELRRYFRDPAGYTERHEAKLIETLISRGKEERRARSPRALHYFNRVLSLDETNEEVLAFVEAMTARNRVRRVLEVGAVLITVTLVVLGVGYGIWGGDSGRGEADAAVAVAPGLDSGSTDQDGAADGAPEIAVDGGALATAGDGGPAVDGGDGGQRGGKIRRPIGIPAKRRLVRIVPDPQAARIVIDGRDYGEYGSALAQGIELELGWHNVTLIPRDKMYRDSPHKLYVKAGEASDGPQVKRMPLRFREALVRINTDADGATVYIPGRARSRANRIFEVRMESAQEQLEIVVAADGFRSRGLTVVLHAGQEYSLPVELEPETQAKVPVTDAMP